METEVDQLPTASSATTVVEVEVTDIQNEEVGSEEKPQEVKHSALVHSGEKKIISVSNVIALMKLGYTRTPSTKGYDESIGSIQTYFDLTTSQMSSLFKDPRLKHARTSFAKRVDNTLVITD